ncbi:type II secretion system protein [Niveibacterium sp. SC-1]|uniref:type II secretion system protein n=1 Tax=Niveibacterium sp. SC-1 TaxID=3135646 RepID=UPI00311FB9CC
MRTKREGGFTFLGILLFVVLLGIASMATLTAADALAQRAAEEELLQIGEEFNQAFLSYFNRSPAGVRHFPLELDELVHDPRFPNTVRHLRKIYPDPLSGRIEWGLMKSPQGEIVGVYSLAEGRPIRQVDLLADPAVLPPQSAPAVSPFQRYSQWVFGYYTALRQPTPMLAPAPAQGAMR